MRKKIVAGNWKMNTLLTEGEELASAVKSKLQKRENEQVILIPPFTHLQSVNSMIKDSALALGAQNCSTQSSGAYTGEVSAAMLHAAGVKYCLVGHSERRAYFNEKNEDLLLKIKQLLDNDIQPVFCCGEQLEDRNNGNHFNVIEEQCELLWDLSEGQFNNLIIAYEPVWAIGTGETASAEQAQEIHAFIRGMIEKELGKKVAEETTILYGGSCKPANAKELFAENDIDGGLIGGAALKADDFVAIVNSL